MVLIQNVPPVLHQAAIRLGCRRPGPILPADQNAEGMALARGFPVTDGLEANRRTSFWKPQRLAAQTPRGSDGAPSRAMIAYSIKSERDPKTGRGWSRGLCAGAGRNTPRHCPVRPSGHRGGSLRPAPATHRRRRGTALTSLRPASGMTRRYEFGCACSWGLSSAWSTWVPGPRLGPSAPRRSSLRC
jgi:hypothetical protein